MRLTAVIDRIEGKKAVLLCSHEKIERLEWPVEILPDGSAEGDVLVFEIAKDDLTTAKSKERISELLKKLTTKPKY